MCRFRTSRVFSTSRRHILPADLRHRGWRSFCRMRLSESASRVHVALALVDAKVAARSMMAAIMARFMAWFLELGRRAKRVLGSFLPQQNMGVRRLQEFLNFLRSRLFLPAGGLLRGQHAARVAGDRLRRRAIASAVCNFEFWLRSDQARVSR